MNRSTFIMHVLLPLTAILLGVLYFVQFAQGGTWEWQTCGDGLSGTVRALYYNEKYARLYAGGDFYTSPATEPITVRRFGYWTPGGSWVNIGANSTVRALEGYGANHVFVGGDFTTLSDIAGVASVSAPYVGYFTQPGAAYALGTGLSDAVYSLAYDPSGNLYAGGAASAKKWDGSSWANTTSATIGFLGSKYYSGNVYAVGGGGLLPIAARYNGTQWIQLGGSAWGGLFNAVPYAVTLDNSGNCYAGGAFTASSGITTYKVGKWSGTAWSSLSAGLNGTVYALTTDGTNIYAGGAFTAESGGGNPMAYVAKWDGTNWTALSTGMNGTVYALDWDSQSDILYAGGDFTVAGGKAAYRVARWLLAYSPTPSPPPSPTPRPELYPAVDFARWSNVDDGQAGGGWPTSDIFVYFQNEPLTTAGEPYGYFDTVYFNNYVEVDNAIYAPVIVRLSEGQVTNAVIPEGAWTEVTHDGTTTKIWFPAHTLLSGTSTYYYLGNNGALYHDRRLTAPAWKYAVTPTPSAPLATPTPTAIPATSPSPSPSPVTTPVCAGATALNLWDVSDGVLSTTWSSHTFGYAIRVYTGTVLQGTVSDKDNYWRDASADAYGAVKLCFMPGADNVVCRAGTILTITDADTSTQYQIYLGDIYSTSPTWRWVSSDGSTYTDSSLCTVDQAASGASPTPSPLPTATPVVTDCLTFTHYPVTAEESAIYYILNDNYADLLNTINGGLDSSCFSDEFSIGYNHLDADSVGSVQMRDNAVEAAAIKAGAVTGGTSGKVAASTLTSWNINTAVNQFNYWDVFPGSYKIPLVYQSSYGNYRPYWEWEVRSYWTGATQARADLRLAWKTETDVYDGTVLTVDSRSKWVGIGETNPAAMLDVGGAVRVQGQLQLDRGLGMPWTTWAANTSTPSVGGGMNFKTANTAATNITNFANGYDGQRILVFVADDDTTFCNDSSGSLWTVSTDGPYWGDQTSTYQFVKVGTQWYEYPGLIYPRDDDPTSPGTVWKGVSDDFESNSFAGGLGWPTGSVWTEDECSLKGSAYSPIGSYCARLGDEDQGYMYRAFDSGNAPGTVSVSMQLKRVGTVTVTRSTDASAWTAVTSWTTGRSWAEYSAPLDNSSPSSTFYIRLQSGSGSNPYVYVDNFKIE